MDMEITYDEMEWMFSDFKPVMCNIFHFNYIFSFQIGFSSE